MSLFRVYVDGTLFYHPQMSKLAITDARIEEDAENIDSMTLSAPFNHPYLSAVRPLASTIVCKKGDAVVFEGRALDNGTDFYNTHTWTCESCLAYLKDSVQPPYDYKGTLRGLLELFVSVHNNTVEEKKRFVVGNVTVTDNNDYISYSSVDFTVTLDAIRDKLIKTHGGFLRVRYTGGVKYLDYIPGLIESNRIAVLVLCIPDIGQFLRFRCRRPCRAAVFHQRNRMAGVIDLVPEISGCRTGRCRLRDVALQRVYFSLIRANNHIRHKELLVEVDGETIDAANAAVLSGKLLQMANGALYNADREIRIIHDRKLEMLGDLIEQANGQNVLVAYWYQHDHERIREYLTELGYKPRDLKSDQDIADWNAGKIQVALISPASAGHGLNIQRGGHILIWFSLVWSLELYQQTNARLWRQGQKKVVTIHHILTRDTVDADVLDALKHKDTTQQNLIAAVKAHLTI